MSQHRLHRKGREGHSIRHLKGPKAQPRQDEALERRIEMIEQNFGRFGAPIVDVSRDLSARVRRAEQATAMMERQLSTQVSQAVDAVSEANQAFHDEHVKPYAMNAEAAYSLTSSAQAHASSAREMAVEAKRSAATAESEARSAQNALEEARKEVSSFTAQVQAQLTGSERRILDGLEASSAEMESLRAKLGDTALTERTRSILNSLFKGRVPVKNGNGGTARFEEMGGADAFKAVLTALESEMMGLTLQIEANRGAVAEAKKLQDEARELRANYLALVSGEETIQQSRTHAEISRLTNEAARLEQERNEAIARAKELEANRTEVAALKGKVEEIVRNSVVPPAVKSEPASSKKADEALKALGERVESIEKGFDDLKALVDKRFTQLLTIIASSGLLPPEIAGALVAQKEDE